MDGLREFRKKIEWMGQGRMGERLPQAWKEYLISSFTAVPLIRAVGAVSLAIAHKGVGEAAAAVAASVVAEPR